MCCETVASLYFENYGLFLKLFNYCTVPGYQLSPDSASELEKMGLLRKGRAVFREQIERSFKVKDDEVIMQQVMQQ